MKISNFNDFNFFLFCKFIEPDEPCDASVDSSCGNKSPRVPSPTTSPTSTSVGHEPCETQEIIVSQANTSSAIISNTPSIITTDDEESLVPTSKESEIMNTHKTPSESMLPEEDDSMHSEESEESLRSDKQLSGVEILSRIFPSQSRGVLDLVLNGCGGDLLRAIEHFLSVTDAVRKPPHQHQQQPGLVIPRLPLPPDHVLSNRPPSPPKPSLGSSKSAFTPLVHSTFPPVSHPSPPNYLFPRPPIYTDHLPHRSLTGPSMLPINTGYSSLLPPLLPCIPPLSFPRHFPESTEEHRTELPLDPLRHRENSLTEYTTRLDFLNRPEMRVGIDVRSGNKIRSPESEETT